MWITQGNDVIIDPGLAYRLIKYSRIPKHDLDSILVDRTDEFGVQLAVHQSPMLVGADFAAKKNSVNCYLILGAKAVMCWIAFAHGARFETWLHELIVALLLAASGLLL
jgi:hypothetical protein